MSREVEMNNKRKAECISAAESALSKRGKMEESLSVSRPQRRRSARLAGTPLLDIPVVVTKSGNSVLADIENTRRGNAKKEVQTVKNQPKIGETKMTKTETKPDLQQEPKEEKDLCSEDEPTETRTKSIDETDSSDCDSDDDVTDFEKLRQRNVRDNMAFLAQLGMDEAKSALINVTPGNAKKTQASARGFRERKPKNQNVLPPRPRSLRLQRKDPAGADLPYVPPIEVKDSYSNPERKVGQLKFLEEMRNKDDLEESGSRFVTSLQTLKKFSERPQKLSTDLDRYLQKLSKADITEEHVAKVCPNRIFSMAFHPTDEKVLLAAGDKWGNVGLWDVDSSEGQNGVFCFTPHVRPINHLAFSPYNSSHLYTCGYEGSVRRGDLTASVFDEVFVNPDEDYDEGVPSFDFFSADSMVATTTYGYAYFIDLRSSSTKGESYHELHTKKRVRCVNVHPVKPNYFVTSCNDGLAKIWDNRKMTDSKKKSTPVCELRHGKAVSSAYFSSVTGNKLLTTSMDDMLRIYDTADIGKKTSPSKCIRHNNQTGRWLSKFAASWHPSRDDLFVVGSMNRPRQIELFSESGAKLKEFRNEDWLGSVCSLNAFHPSLDILAGGNSSGRVHIIM